MPVLKFRSDGAEVEVVGMNTASETIVDKLALRKLADVIEPFGKSISISIPTWRPIRMIT